MSPLSIVFFGSGGEYSRIVFEALAKVGNVRAAVLPSLPGRGWRRLIAALILTSSRRRLRAIARRHAIPIVPFDRDVVTALRGFDPDLFCIASFPFLLSEAVREVPRLGGLNLHPSVLPRHRGGDPIFWTYHADDRQAGVTLHWIDGGVDSGDIVDQEVIEFQRGTPGPQLTARLAVLGANLLIRNLDAIAAGTALRTPQNGTGIKRDPLRPSGPWIDFQSWSAERVWHFLRGVGTANLRDRSGRRCSAGSVISFTCAAHDIVPGTFADGRLYCRDGWVVLGRPSFRRRLARLLPRA